MKKRIVALLLCCVMLLTLSPSLIATATADDETTPAQTEVTVSPAKADLPRNKKVTLTAQAKDAKSYQWQIMAEDDLWVDISGETESTIQVSYAMVASLLDGSKAQLRCKTDLGTTDPATVTVTEAQAVAAAPAKAAPKAGTVVKEAEAIGTAVVQDGESDADAPVSQKYTILVTYKFANGDTAADPYIAELAAGSAFKNTIEFPTVQGYLPYLNNEQVNNFTPNIESINQNYTYEVVYQPALVNYTYIYYQQNVNNDEYTEVDRETAQGLTNSAVPPTTKAYPGFYALPYEQPAIAADGTTVVEVYFDRYYYLMTFDLDGGYGVEPIYARYGSKIDVDDSALKKAGYTFDKWDPELPETMPVDGGTYKVVWKVNDTAKVTVVFWGENANDEDYSYIKSSEIQVKPGTEFTYAENGALICALEEHTHRAACYELTCTQEEHTHSASCGYACGQTEHRNHSTNCYAGVGSRADAGTGAPQNPSNGYVYRKAWTINDQVIYINGEWYDYTGQTSNGSIAPTTCGLQLHTHSASCGYNCGKTAHTHTDYTGSCYTLTCGKTEHSHTSSCYMSGAGLDSKLWKFVRSDTVTVAADGSTVVNVYYDRVEYSVKFYSYSTYVSNPVEYSQLRITAKWGANISDKWPTYNNSNTWSVTDRDSTYQVNMQTMPVGGDEFYGPKTGNGSESAHYYVEILPGEVYTETYKGLQCKWHHTDTSPGTGYSVSDDDKYELTGFEFVGYTTKSSNDYDGAKFFYNRKSFTLEFNDGYKTVKTESVKYETPLSTYQDFVPTVPEEYEAGSVYFGGWYLNPECTGKEYKLDEHTMPADNVLLYAKWVPVTHTVRTWLTDKLDTSVNVGDTNTNVQEIPHGSTAIEPKTPENGNYKFVGWFYTDENGVEKGFHFSMPIRKDLDLYAKWSSTVLVPYTVYYRLQNTDTDIADPTVGSGLAATTKTFKAKGGTALYADYQEGYFPLAKSTSITLNAEGENVCVIDYVARPAVSYVVKYLDKGTGVPVAPQKNVDDNRKAIVTENFVTVKGMMPDAYQKTLVVSAEDGAVNEIIFYYIKDTTHAYYKITHYTENLELDAQGNRTWTEYNASQLVGDIGTEYTAEAITIPGFTYDPTVDGTVAKGELTADGLELKLYYTRNSYPYQVRYLEKGTNKELAPAMNGTGKYGRVILENAIAIHGYVADAAQKTATIRIENPADVAKLNIITFYYTEQTVDITYKVVGPNGCGTVTPASETVKVITGTPTGSVAAKANDNFKFVGWYKDEACTQPVDSSWVANNKLTPDKTKNYGTAEKPVMGYEAATYYAKFEYNVTDLTITKTYAAGALLDENQSAVFTVTGDGTSIDVVIHGNGRVVIKGLKVGTTYTVTEKVGWTWRYGQNSESIKLKATGNNVAFTNELNNNKWLTGGAWCDNVWGNNRPDKSTSPDYSTNR